MNLKCEWPLMKENRMNRISDCRSESHHDILCWNMIAASAWCAVFVVLRKSVPPSVIIEKSDDADSSSFSTERKVGSYVSMDHEFGLLPLVEYIWILGWILQWIIFFCCTWGFYVMKHFCRITLLMCGRHKVKQTSGTHGIDAQCKDKK